MRVSRVCVALAALVLVACVREAAPGRSDATARFNGTWTTDGGELKMWALDERRLQVEFRGEFTYESAAGPMVNVGAADGIAVLEGDAAHLEPDAPEGDCVITLRPSGDRLEVAQSGACGFGLNVTAAGTYQRVSPDRPRFEPT